MESSKENLIPDAALGTLIFIFTEMMFFAGLLSAFEIVKNSPKGGAWPPPFEPSLPFYETMVNSLVLLFSAFLLLKSFRYFHSNSSKCRQFFLATIIAGTFFVVFQGVEWVILLSKGLTMTSSSLGSFFYLLIGFHGLHAILALVILSHFYSKLKRDELNLSEFKAVGFFWAFVVGLWPIIYFKVYP